MLVCLAVTNAQAAPANEDSALPGVTDEPTTPSEGPADLDAPSEPSESPSDLAEPSEPSEDPSDLAEPSEGPSDLAAPSEPGPPTQSPTPPPATVTSTSVPTSSTPTPTSSPAPQARASSTADEPAERARPSRTTDDGDSEAAATDDDASEDEEDDEPIKHKGFIIDLRVGTIGCTKSICDRHGAKPGFRLDGMLGRNFFGFLDLGLAGGWGTMGTDIAPGTNGLSLYGLDPATLPPEAAALMFDQFTVDDAKLQTIQGGLDVRVHILPRGRFDPYVGVGAQYTQFRGLYDTPGGSTRLGFHGLAFPLQAGFVVFATKRIALGAQFDWLWSWYGGITIRGAPGDFAAPIPAIKDAAAMAGVDLPGDLPHMWTVGAVVHLRLGRD